MGVGYFLRMLFYQFGSHRKHLGKGCQIGVRSGSEVIVVLPYFTGDDTFRTADFIWA